MYYEYEKHFFSDQAYLKTIDKIESLKDELNINGTKIKPFIEKDIFDTNNLEGNSLTRSEVTYLLENNVTIRGKSIKDHLQIHNCEYAMNALKNEVYRNISNPSEELIATIHHIVTVNELPDEESGFYRNEPVHIRYTNYIPPIETDVPYFMKELIKEYSRPLDFGETKFERICEFKRNFERIHPFIDGNGRTGRLVMNILLLNNGYGYFSAPAEERDKYFKSLDDGSFVKYAAEKVLKNMELIKARDNYELINPLSNNEEEVADYGSTR